MMSFHRQLECHQSVGFPSQARNKMLYYGEIYIYSGFFFSIIRLKQKYPYILFWIKTTQRFFKANMCVKQLEQCNCISHLHSLIRCLLLTKHNTEAAKAGL